MNNIKRTILIDLDGVLNTYDGKFDEKFIPPINDGALEFIEKLSKKYTLKIFTTRNLLLTSKWVFDNKIEKFITDVTNVKEPAYLMINDRCLNFKGNYVEIETQIKGFESWYK